MEKQNNQLEHGQPMEIPVSLLANGFDVRSELHRQVSFAAVIHFFVIHESMNGCKNLKIHYRIA